MATWHYGGSQPHATKNDWKGTFSTTAKQAEFESVTITVTDDQFNTETGLTGVSLPNATSVGIDGFGHCVLTELNLPKVQIIVNAAFYLSQLVSLNLPECTKIMAGAFNKSKLTSLSLPKVKTIDGYVFQQSLLTSLYLPECTSIRIDAFQNSPLESLSLPKCTTIGNEAFASTVNDIKTRVTMLSKFNTGAEKNRIFGSDWSEITFDWDAHGILTPNTVSWNGRICDTQFDWNGKTVIKFIWKGRECILKAVAPPTQPSGPFDPNTATYRVLDLSSKLTELESHWREFAIHGNKAIFCNDAGNHFMTADVDANGDFSNFQALDLSSKLPQVPGRPDLILQGWSGVHVHNNKIYFINSGTQYWTVADIDNNGNMSNFKHWDVANHIPAVSGGYWTGMYINNGKAYFINTSRRNWMTADVDDNWNFSNFNHLDLTGKLSDYPWWDMIIDNGKVLFIDEQSAHCMTADIDDSNVMSNFQTIDMTSKLKGISGVWTAIQKVNDKVYFVNTNRAKWVIAEMPTGGGSPVGGPPTYEGEFVDYTSTTQRPHATASEIAAEFTALKDTTDDYQFLLQKKLTSISVPSVTTIGRSSFAGCDLLTKLSAPNVKIIKDYAFHYDNLASIVLPEATEIGAGAFEIYRARETITEVNVPKATTIGDNAFLGMVNAQSTTVTMKSKFNTTAEKDRLFGANKWNNITFTWV